MIATHGLAPLALPSGRALPGRPRLAGGLAPLLGLLRAWRLRRRYRADLRRLLRLGAYLIDDVGLGLGEAVEESGKPFWRA